MFRLFYALLVGIIGAGIVHIAIIFLLPANASNDAWSRIAAIAEPYQPVLLENVEPSVLPASQRNPFLRAVACRFDLEDGPVRLSAEEALPFWSMSLYDQSGLNVFSISDRAAPGASPDLLVLTSEQLAAMRTEMPAEFDQSLFVETDIEQGLIVMRVLVPDATYQRRVGRALASIACKPA
ncbi:DUF1254 domain-containing protein [Nitratireductor basaltis]|uniref:Putative integral membrane protein n=1 Tax=Nitratireductor basaltis TaxID=472175 RepID=A0A084UCH7_9HYPH|nr:DUF1254 domain-containing protein [Nitratireductor basaltis]KFB10663.1 putative integral membrane protein [Nitratireductor basaltis]